MDTRITNARESLHLAKRPAVDWHGLSTAERIGHLELEGYVVIPEVLSSDDVRAITAEVDALPTFGMDYSEQQRAYKDVQWSNSPRTIDVIAHPNMIKFLSTLFGDDIVCTSCTFTCSRPGHPGIAIHTDAQPYGSRIFGVQASSPVLVRCLFYLDELTPERSPLKVIPRSHLSLHRNGNPYCRYLCHPDEVMVTCQAGSCAIINQKVFHANYPNHSDSDRRMLAIAYRPAWAGPIADIEDWPADKLSTLPAHVRPFFKSLNTRCVEFDLPNRPDNLAEDAPGISPHRWDDKLYASGLDEGDDTHRSTR